MIRKKLYELDHVLLLYDVDRPINFIDRIIRTDVNRQYLGQFLTYSIETGSVFIRISRII